MDSMTRRPDIVQAEENLIAANAEIGVARSLYYPDIAITGAGLVRTACRCQNWDVDAVYHTQDV